MDQVVGAAIETGEASAWTVAGTPDLNAQQALVGGPGPNSGVPATNAGVSYLPEAQAGGSYQLDERRGRPTAYLSYWAAQRRRVRTEVFGRRDSGEEPAEIGAALGLPAGEVESLLQSDRRRPTNSA